MPVMCLDLYYLVRYARRKFHSPLFQFDSRFLAMGAMETLYKVCTGLGTTIFALIFLNYYLEAKDEGEESDKNTKSKK